MWLLVTLKMQTVGFFETSVPIRVHYVTNHKNAMLIPGNLAVAQVVNLLRYKSVEQRLPWEADSHPDESRNSLHFMETGDSLWCLLVTAVSPVSLNLNFRLASKGQDLFWYPATNFAFVMSPFLHRVPEISDPDLGPGAYCPTFCFVLFCFALLCFVLFCFVLFCFVLFCFASLRFASFRFVLFCFVLFCFVLFCFVLSCFVLFCCRDGGLRQCF